MSNRPIGEVNTPLKNLTKREATNLRVIDPGHPLYGRQFPIHHISKSLQGDGQVMVKYQENMLLRIPIAATDLSDAPSTALSSKLSLQSLTEFISTAQQCEVLCTASPRKPGNKCPKNCKLKPLRTSPRSSRR